MTTCTYCKKSPENLKTCAKCKVAQYCNRDCQKASWKSHKKICVMLANSNNTEQGKTYSTRSPKNLEKHITNPFTRLDEKKYFQDRSETDVFKLLIDSFRIRAEDDKKFEGKVTPNSIYDGASSSILPFREYLGKAASRNLLPSWWSADKQKECEAFGESDAWNNLRIAVEKQDIIQHYEDSSMPMQLRMFAEAVYGRGSMGQDGTFMRKQMAAVEKSGGGSNMRMYSMS